MSLLKNCADKRTTGQKSEADLFSIGVNSTVMQHRYIIFTGIAVFLPAAASANALIPYMAVPWGQLFLFPMVVLIEAPFIRTETIKFGRALFHSLIANIASTIVGAGLYLATMPHIDDQIFNYWFKGQGGTETFRGLVIALGLAGVLGVLSWVIESVALARLRKINRNEVALPVAKANLVTYSILVFISLLFS